MSRPLPHYPTQTQRTARADKTGLIPGRPGEAPDAKLVAQLAHVGRVLLVMSGIAAVIGIYVGIGVVMGEEAAFKAVYCTLFGLIALPAVGLLVHHIWDLTAGDDSWRR